jgi:hypothetical protein
VEGRAAGQLLLLLLLPLMTLLFVAIITVTTTITSMPLLFHIYHRHNHISNFADRLPNHWLQLQFLGVRRTLPNSHTITHTL